MRKQLRRSVWWVVAVVCVFLAGSIYWQVESRVFGQLAVAAPAKSESDLKTQLDIYASKLKADDIESQLELARWAQDKGLHREAIDIAKRAASRDEDNVATYTAMIEIANAAKLPRDPRLERQVLRELGQGFKVHYAPHFVVFYKADRNWALARAALLERTHDVYFETMVRAGYRPEPLRYPLVAILFGDHDEYLAYAKRVDKADMGWAGGYYWTATNRVTFFDDRDSPMLRQFVARKEALENRLKRINEAIPQAQRTGNRQLVQRFRQEQQATVRELTWYRNRFKALARLGNVAKTTHEAVHQLAFNTGLQYRTTYYPFWYAEGIATCFETDDPAGKFGPYSGNWMREQSLKSTLERDALISVKEMVRTLRPSVRNEQRLGDWYGQSWALYRYLFRFKREELREYAAALNEQKAGNVPTPDEMEALFVKHFGRIDLLEKKFEKQVKTGR